MPLSRLAPAVLFGFVLACGGGDGSGPPEEILTLEIAGGDGQQGTVGGPVPDPLSVRVVTAQGEPRSDTRIGFAVQSGDAALPQTEATTDETGVASVALTLGEQAGPIVVTASGADLRGSPVTFDITASADVPALMTAESGNDEVAFAGRAFPVPVSALVEDRFGNPVPNVEVAWTVQGGGGSVSPATSTTGDHGLASASWTAGPAAGENLLRASVAAGPAVVYTGTGVLPGAGRIAVSAWGLPVGGIHLMNPDGSGFALLPDQGTGSRNPVWSPDGSRLAYNTLRFGGVEVAVMNADGSGLVRATPMPDGAFAEVAGWSPDGTRILFISNVDLPDAGQLYVANADGSGTRQPVPNTEGTVSADWSPDGERIVLFSGKAPDGIFIVNADGSGPERLADGEDPRWSRDGGKIAFNGSRSGGGFQPMLMNPDGSRQQHFPGTAGDLQLKFQSWSPDGTKALFTANPGESGDDDEFYSMNVDGTGLIRVTDDAVYTLGGSWGP
jgi:hypothetical protein